MSAGTDSPAPDSASIAGAGAAMSESLLRVQDLRKCWELASVLNFWHVFRPVIQSGMEVTAEEIEEGLVSPDDTLAKLHIALLRGIPPCNRKFMEADGWVLALSKKLSEWWPWVAVGEYPFVTAQGGAISEYKEFDPVTRLLILKALCEIRALQDDILWFIDDSIKNGSELSNFRKNRIGGDQRGTAYWYDGDPVVGYRLYKEVNQVRYSRKIKGKGRSLPDVNCEWETLATNLGEFLNISDNLVSSKAKIESAVGNYIKSEIIPVLVQRQKMKERKLKRKKREEMFLGAFHEVIGTNRPRRTCRPVNYSYDEYDRSIREAIKLSTKGRASHEQSYEGEERSNVLAGESIPLNGNNSATIEENGIESSGDDFPDFDHDGDLEDGDDDYNGDVVEDTSDGIDDFMKIQENDGKRKTKRHVVLQNGRGLQDVGLRRSARNAACTTSYNDETLELRNGTDAETKKRLGERPASTSEAARNIDSDVEEEIVDDSEDEEVKIVSDSEAWSSD